MFCESTQQKIYLVMNKIEEIREWLSSGRAEKATQMVCKEIQENAKKGYADKDNIKGLKRMQNFLKEADTSDWDEEAIATNKHRIKVMDGMIEKAESDLAEAQSVLMKQVLKSKGEVDEFGIPVAMDWGGVLNGTSILEVYNEHFGDKMATIVLNNL